MTFGQSIKTVFGNLSRFGGRARRSEFWWFYLFTILVSIPASLLICIPIFVWIGRAGSTLGPDGTMTDDQTTGLLTAVVITYGLALLLGAVLFFLTLAVWVRRLHDAGYSGHWLWLSLVGLGIVPLIFAILEGQPYPNRWGPDPKALEHGVWPMQQAGPVYAEPGSAPTAAAPTAAAPAMPPLDPGPDMVAPPPMTPVPPASADATDPFAAPPSTS